MSWASLEAVAMMVLRGIWRASWQASLLMLLILTIQSLLGRRLNGRSRYLLWSIVLIRLLLPALPQSRLSVFNLANLSVSRFTSHDITATLPLSEISERAGERVLQSQIKNQKSQIEEPSPQPSPGVPGEGEKRNAAMLRAILIAWLAGLFALSLRVIRECFRTRHLVRQFHEITDPQIRGIVESCASSIGLRHLPRILSGDAIQTPAVVGVWRPALLLPSHVPARCDRRQISMIVMHELAHLKRHDIAANWLVTIATVLHWFNPLVWILAWRIRADRELACDELVLSGAAGSDCDAQTYGNTLLALAEMLSPPTPHKQLVGILESSSPLERRIRMIAAFESTRTGYWPWLAVLLLVLGCTTLTDSLHGQATKPLASEKRPAQVPPETDVKGDHASVVSDADIRSKLQRVLPELNFNQVAFMDVMDYLRDACGVNLVVEWRSLEQAGIDRNALISARLKQVTLAQAMNHVLRDVGGGVVKLDYTVEDGAIVVSTEEDISGHTETVFYDVSDLVGSGTPSIEKLCGVITSTIAAETWHQNGGNLGRLETFNNKLIITTTPKLHEQIANLLTRLREKPATQPQPLSW